MPNTTGKQICTLALQAIGQAGAAGSSDISPEDMNFALTLANGMVDAFSMDRLFIFNENFTEFPLVANKQTYTVGPGGDFAYPSGRPSRIVSAQLKLNTSPATYLDLNPLDDDGFSRLPVLDVPPAYPTAFYYTPSVPLGTMLFWVTPQGGLFVRIETWNQFGQFPDLSTSVSFPQAYFELLWTNLAERCSIPAFGIEQVSPSIALLASQARGRVQGLNMSPPAQMVVDGGVQGVRNTNQTGYRNLYVPSPIWYSNGR